MTSRSDPFASRGIVAAFVILAGLSLGGCTADGSDPMTSERAPQQTASPTPTLDPDTDREVEEAALPMPPSEIRAWADGAVPNSGSEGFQDAVSGWLGERTSKQATSSFETLPPGAYVAQIACQGDGSITVTMSALDDQALDGGPQGCRNEVVAFDVTTTATGLRATFSLDGAPAIYAMSLQSAPTSG